MKNKCTYIVLLLLLPCLFLQAQRVGSWKSYRAYHNATQVVTTPNRVFAVYDGSLLSYSPEDQEVSTYSFEDGLSDIGIKFLAYSTEAKALLVIYDNSKMDVFMGKNDVVPLPDIYTNRAGYSVNNVMIQGQYAYLSTGFGIVVVDLNKKVIKESYSLYLNTTAVCLWENDIYAATPEGILKASLSSPNLSDKNYWQFIPRLSGGNDKNITKMVVFDDHLVFYDGAGIFSLSKEGQVKSLITGMCRQLSLMNGQLAVAVYNSVFFYTDLNQYSKLILDADYRAIASAYNSKENYWIAWGNNGLFGIKAEPQAGTSEWKMSILEPELKVNSPFRNLTFQLNFDQGKLLVTGGGRTVDRLTNPGTLMVYENNQWYNFDDKVISEKTGLQCRDLMFAVVDPRDPNHYFVSSWGEGVYEFKDNELVDVYSYTNSSLQSASPNNRPELYVRVEGMGFDRENNLYVTNVAVANGLSIFNNANKWQSYNYQGIAGNHPTQLIVTKNNQKWVSNSRIRAGVFALDENNQEYYSNNFVDQQGTNIGATAYLCLAEDLSGLIWVGTDNGPVSFSSIEQMGKGICDRVIAQDQYGSEAGNGYYLLEGERITTITVDGANRKWMGTIGNGVFVVENSGSVLKVENLNTTNSQILSDNVNSIAINNETGEVFIATDKGLCSYIGEAIGGKYDFSNVYAFPNPVHPARELQVVITGLMQNSTVKITDLAGNLMNTGLSHGGQYIWHCNNQRGEIVKAGIYLVFAANSDGSQGVVTKIMVIK